VKEKIKSVALTRPEVEELLSLPVQDLIDRLKSIRDQMVPLEVARVPAKKIGNRHDDRASVEGRSRALQMLETLLLLDHKAISRALGILPPFPVTSRKQRNFMSGALVILLASHQDVDDRERAAERILSELSFSDGDIAGAIVLRRKNQK
jgi:hypothetical protein